MWTPGILFCIFAKPCFYMICSVLGAGVKVSAGKGCRSGLHGAGHNWLQQTHGADAAQGTARTGLFGELFFQCHVGL